MSRTDLIFTASATTRPALRPSVVGNYVCLPWYIGGQPDVCLGSMADADRGRWRTGTDGVTVRNHRHMCSASSVVDSHDRRSGGIDLSDSCGDMGHATGSPVSCTKFPPYYEQTRPASAEVSNGRYWMAGRRRVQSACRKRPINRRYAEPYRGS